MNSIISLTVYLGIMRWSERLAVGKKKRLSWPMMLMIVEVGDSVVVFNGENWRDQIKKGEEYI